MPRATHNRWLMWSLRACVLALALYSFAESTADPDLWGHVLFGQRMLARGAVERVEPFSWTAHGGPWINHEVLAEAVLGMTHSLGGSRGLLLLKLAIGMLTFGIVLRLACRRLDRDERTTAWVVGAVGVVEIAFGFAARPQIFTALGLAILLWLLVRVAEGTTFLAWTIPLLFLVWFNTHGGAVAGLALLAVVIATLALRRLRERQAPGRTVLALALAAVAGALTAFCNPWGKAGVIWLLKSVSWSRPAIAEWNPTAFGWDHAPFFLLMGLAVFALLGAPRNRRGAWWTWAVLALLAAAALRYVRHTPLFAIAAVAFLPGPLHGALGRWKGHAPSLLTAVRARWFRFAGTSVLLAATLSMFLGLFLRREHPFAMEVPRDQYPVAAIEFVRQNGLSGKLLTWFDWGEMCLWELPDCPVSIDGRLDTCYPMSLIDAHWRFYGGSRETGPELDVRAADLALLPIGLKGLAALRAAGDWQPVYRDPLAEVWVRDVRRFPGLNPRPLPVIGPAAVIAGRAIFPRKRAASSFPPPVPALR